MLIKRQVYWQRLVRFLRFTDETCIGVFCCAEDCFEVESLMDKKLKDKECITKVKWRDFESAETCEAIVITFSSQ